jgi:hypothetical protein
MAALRFNAMPGVKVIHSNSRISETVWGLGNFYKVRLFNRLRALSALRTGRSNPAIRRDQIAILRSLVARKATFLLALI